MSLHNKVRDFAVRWGPGPGSQERLLYRDFITDLRELLEAYGKACLEHESLPDTEHEHGDPV